MMMTYCNRGTLISIDDLKSEHEKCQADALIYFDRADCHMGGDELYFASYKKLEEVIFYFSITERMFICIYMFILDIDPFIFISMSLTHTIPTYGWS